MRVIDAALEAARIRMRPILMTSFSFIFGVLPLAMSTGAGANSRIAIGTSVIGGMLTATILAIFYIPLFFVLVRRGVRDGLAMRARARSQAAGGRSMKTLRRPDRAARDRLHDDGAGLCPARPGGPGVLAGRRPVPPAERSGASRGHLSATSSAIRGCSR